MKQTLNDFVTRLALVSKLSTDEQDLIEKLYLLGETVSIGVAAEVFVEEPRPADHALRAFLEALPEDILYSILVLMYAGRDEEEEVLDHVGYICEAIPTKERAVLAIHEKVHRVEYIEKGIEYLGRDNLNVLLEKVREKIAPGL